MCNKCDLPRITEADLKTYKSQKVLESQSPHIRESRDPCVANEQAQALLRTPEVQKALT